MTKPAEAPARNLIDGVDVNAVALAARGCPGVEDLHAGFPGEVATYLPGNRLAGVRVRSDAVEVQVRAAWDTPAPQIAAGIRAAVAPLAGGRAVDVIIGDLGDPPGTGRIDPPGTGQVSAAREPGGGAQAPAKLGWPTNAGDQQSGASGAEPPTAEGK